MQSFRFLQKPNIPDADITLCAIASGFPHIKAALQTRGIEVIEVEPLSVLQEAVRCHADMQLHDLGQGRAVAASGAKRLKAELETRGFHVEEQPLQPQYPDDIALNCFYINRKLFCKEKYTAEHLLNYCQSNGGEVVNVKQGYAKCSTAIVNKNAIITADASIAKAAENSGLEVLRIQSGGILLHGYDTGFIGGCCGLISGKTLAFTGRLAGHPDAEKMRAFCESKGIAVVELTDTPLIDIGGILPLAT